MNVHIGEILCHVRKNHGGEDEMIAYTLIGFICGFICREVILRRQVTQARQEIQQRLQHLIEQEKRNENNSLES